MMACMKLRTLAVLRRDRRGLRGGRWRVLIGAVQ